MLRAKQKPTRPSTFQADITAHAVSEKKNLPNEAPNPPKEVLEGAAEQAATLPPPGKKKKAKVAPLVRCPFETHQRYVSSLQDMSMDPCGKCNHVPTKQLEVSSPQTWSGGQRPVWETKPTLTKTCSYPRVPVSEPRCSVAYNTRLARRRMVSKIPSATRMAWVKRPPGQPRPCFELQIDPGPYWSHGPR